MLFRSCRSARRGGRSGPDLDGVLGQRCLCQGNRAFGRNLWLDLCCDRVPDLGILERQCRVLRGRIGDRDRAGLAKQDLRFFDQEAQAAIVRQAFQHNQAKALGQVRHINLGQGIIGKQAEAAARISLLNRPAQTQGRDRAAMAAGID